MNKGNISFVFARSGGTIKTKTTMALSEAAVCTNCSVNKLVDAKKLMVVKKNISQINVLRYTIKLIKL